MNKNLAYINLYSFSFILSPIIYFIYHVTIIINLNTARHFPVHIVTMKCAYINL